MSTSTRYMLLRHAADKRPVAFCTVPVPYAFKTMVESFSEPEHCQVKVVECDGNREKLYAHFKDDSGWRAPRL